MGHVDRILDLPATAAIRIALALCVALCAAGCRTPVPRYEQGSAAQGSAAQGGATRWGDDLIAGGSIVTLSDTIPGDVMVAGGDLRFAGMAGGDYLGAGGGQEIGGRVLGDVRAAGGQVLLTGDVANNATVAGGQVTLGEGAVVRRNAYLAGGSVRVDGTVMGLLRAAGSDVVLDGTVGGDVRVEAEHLRVGPGAHIAGELRYRVSPENVTIDPGAEVTGRVVALPPRPRPPIELFHVLWLIGFLVAGTIAVLLFAGVTRAAEAALRRRPAAALGFGLVWVIAVPIAVIIVGLTGIGVPLALITGALYVISLYLGRVVVAVWLGRLVLRGRAAPGRGRLVLAFLIGGVILLLLGRIPVLGPIVMIAATVLGLGSLVTAFQARGTEPAAG
ncbi:MAG TPA: hypothetical protein VF188_13315 [Longimicrobiales bacterium]